MYVGGTVSADLIPPKAEGNFDLSDPKKLIFTVRKADQKQFVGKRYELPWERVELIEYGQKVGHRVKTAILLSPVALFSKARHHYVTLSYKDADGNGQAAVFEVGKSKIREALPTLRARTGKDVVPTDDEARKQLAPASIATIAQPTSTASPTSQPNQRVAAVN
jgi:hypothetical protein